MSYIIPMVSCTEAVGVLGIALPCLQRGGVPAPGPFTSQGVAPRPSAAWPSLFSGCALGAGSGEDHPVENAG